ncbi:MAG: DacC [Firmicutes bacterium]|nr:DacC [Bacillota bacterium]
MFNKVAIGGMAALLCLLTTMPVVAASNSPPALQGRATVLLDAASGQILYQMNGTDHNFPASTTKLLTALVAVEHGKLDQIIDVSDRAVDQPADSSSCYLERGEHQSLQNLLYGLMLVSGNDCAMAIAEGVSGGHPEQFVTWMNETATRLGATHSNFANPSGLHDPNHYTTAIDLGLIARVALANPTLRGISGTKEFYWPVKSDRNGPYYNHNQMLSTYAGTIAGKNGYTEEAGLTLVNVAQRDGRMLIGVVMGEPNQQVQYADMAQLLDYGFTAFEQKSALPAGLHLADVPVAQGLQPSVAVAPDGAFLVSAPKGDKPNVTVESKLQKNVSAPVAAGQKVGALEIREADRLLAVLPIVAQQGIAAKPNVAANLSSWGVSGAKWAAGVMLALLLFRTTVKNIRRGRRRSRGRTSAPATFRRSSGRGDFLAYDRTKGR